MTPHKIIEPIWLRMIGSRFDSTELTKIVVRDGGADMEPLSTGDLFKLGENQFEGKWGSVVFSFSELLAYYANGTLDKFQIISWCFAVLIIGEANRRHETGWEVHLYVITKAFDQVTEILTYPEFASVLKCALDPELSN